MSVRRTVFCSLMIGIPLSAQIFSASFKPFNISGAPFSAHLTIERAVIGADGTQITLPAEESTMYRDSAGRSRLESDPRNHNCSTPPCLVTIVDPLAGFRYEINAYRRLVERFAIPASHPQAVDPPSQTPDITVPYPQGMVSTRPIIDGAVRGIGTAANHFKTTSEFLGTQIIEGITVRGGRIVTTLEAGAADNDRAVAVTDESWASKELRIMVLKKVLDPRYGDTISRLTHVSLVEPDPALFMTPSNYMIKDMPTYNP
jgi:hypothetical protein